MHPLQFTFAGSLPLVSLKPIMLSEHAFLPKVRCGFPHFGLQDWIVQPWTDCHFAGEHFSVNSGLGPVFATFIPLAVVTAAAIVIATLRRERRLPLVAFPVFMSAILLGYWWFFMLRLLRLTLHAFAVMFPLLGYGIGLLSGLRQRIAAGLFACALATNALLLVVSPLEGLGSRIYHQAWSRNAYYEVPEVIDALAPDSVVLNAGHELKNYALFGRNLRNRVVTTRALVEPERVTRVTGAFIRKWQIEYIFYATDRNLVLEDEGKYHVVHRQEVENEFGRFVEILYRTDRSPKGPERAGETAGRGWSDPGEGG